MTNAPMDRRELLIAALVSTFMILVAGGMGMYVLSDPGFRSAQQLATAAHVIDTYFHDEIDWVQAMEDGHKAMIDRLDRFSLYLTADQMQRLRDDQSGGYDGIGVTVAGDSAGVLIISVRQEGPAAIAGLLPGDVIVEADGHPLTGLELDEASAYLRGDDGTKLATRVARPAEDDTLEVTIVRSRLEFEHIPFAGYTDDSVLYLRLSGFEPGAADAVEATLDSLFDGVTATALVLDLRGNPGGMFTESYRIADLFLDEGELIVGTNGRSRWETDEYWARSADQTKGLAMAILVDQGTASAAEILAGALQQNGRACIIGDTTYGKGLVQGFFGFPDGDGLRLTVSRYYLENNVYLNDFDSSLNDVGRGLVPDYLIAIESDLEFVRAVEIAMILPRFAYRHQAQILTEAAADTLNDAWIGLLADDAIGNGWEYAGVLTELATISEELSQIGDHASDTRRMARQAADLARQDDRRQFVANGSYLKRRLVQLVVQRARSTYASYAEAVIDYDPAIRMATRLLIDDQGLAPDTVVD